MDQRISFVTLAVTDLEASARFYLDGLGWQPAFRGDNILMVEVGDGLTLSLWSENGFIEEVGPIRRGEGLVPVTLAHNCATAVEVDAVLDEARAAGATTVQAATQRDWGGYSGYFADPDGYRWEIAFNPDELGQEVLS